MKRNLITKKELEYVQKHLPAMGDFQMHTGGGAFVGKVDRHVGEIAIEIAEGDYEYFYFNEKTTIEELKGRARRMGVEWRREVEQCKKIVDQLEAEK